MMQPSLTLWINPDTLPISGDAALLSQQDGSGIGRTWLALTSTADGVKLKSYLGNLGSIGNTTITTDAWTHVALSYHKAPMS